MRRPQARIRIGRCYTSVVKAKMHLSENRSTPSPPAMSWAMAVQPGAGNHLLLDPGQR